MAPTNGDTLQDKVVEIDTPYYLGQKVVRHLATPSLGSFYISENKTKAESYAIEWAYPEDNGVPALLHSDMRDYWPASAQTVPTQCMAAIDDQLETVTAICEDIGV